MFSPTPGTLARSAGGVQNAGQGAKGLQQAVGQGLTRLPGGGSKIGGELQHPGLGEMAEPALQKSRFIRSRCPSCTPMTGPFLSGFCTFIIPLFALRQGKDDRRRVKIGRKTLTKGETYGMIARK